MKQSRIIAFVLIILTVGVLFYFPETNPVDFVNKKLAIEKESSKKGSTAKKPAQTVVEKSDFIKEQVAAGKVATETNNDFNKDGKNDILVYKVLHPLQGKKAKSAPANAVRAISYAIYKNFQAKRGQALLDLRSDGIFQAERRIIPVKTPVYAYQVREETIKKGKQSARILKVSLLDQKHEIASEEIVIYWDTQLNQFQATNIFETDRAF